MRDGNEKYSRKEDPNLIYGIRAVIEAIDAGRQLNKVFVQTGLEGEIFKELRDKMKSSDVVYQQVPIQKLNRLTQNNHQGVVAYASPIEYQSLDAIITATFEKGEAPFIFILDRVTDVRNMGSIARSAECHGVHAIVIPSRGNAGVTADAIKTSAGALNKIPVCREHHLKDAILLCQQSGIKVVACTEKTDQLLYDAGLGEPIAVIMGSEEDGVSKEYLKVSDDKVKIPMEGTIASLNVAVSAGIVMYEINRQRKSER
ncbi:23S rRNA (guanosine(2251)-2'-O)-methyltransferase RlmB [Parvicella tangerina]|uniref:TrmH family tRNA/rRNA methyltransferase n=1 Tax=Parvicella tangerina TaxID=2829795 RepID=A0A916JSK3_9FLAO|nr:23S rRNA (guanosine(2251)-2'-O)-methyltransferase RlmB [Parvicella tangerina]CAG5087137.1 Putative TrmH family tRNA/rRNA methyltransferase [Parvicella tangerina]